MPDDLGPKELARNNAEKVFARAKQAAVAEQDRAISERDAKTARLKAQRLAQSAEDKLGPKKG